MSLQQSGQATMPTTSMSMAGSSHGTAPGYSHAVPSSQNLPMQSQGTIANYVSRANINLPTNPGKMNTVTRILFVLCWAMQMVTLVTI